MESFFELRKLWARIEIKLAVEPCLSVESKFFSYLPLYGFCIDVTEDSLNKAETCSRYGRVTNSSSSIGTTVHCGLWPVEQCPSIISYLPPTLSPSSHSQHLQIFLLPLSILSWVFPFASSLPVLEWRSFWASYPPPFSLDDLTNLSLLFYPFYYIFSFVHIS